MPRYIVSYDLRGEARDKTYEALEKEFEGTYKAKRLLESVWGLSSELTLDQLYDDLIRLVNIGDGLLVVCIGRARGFGIENKLSSF